MQAVDLYLVEPGRVNVAALRLTANEVGVVIAKLQRAVSEVRDMDARMARSVAAATGSS